MDGSTASRARQSTPDSSSATTPPGAGGNAALFSSDTVIRPREVTGPAIPSQAEPASGSQLNRLFPTGPDSSSNASSIDPRGIELAHFRIEERIGMGGMGAVFRALDTRLQRHVALKLLAPSQSVDSAATKRFLNEARAAARLDHENVARVFFIGEERGLHFIAFEFVTGSNIRDLIQKRGRMSAADTINHALQIAYALKHTSAMGVVHRDIKPSNIIITPRGRAKLVDLGLARKDSSESQGELTLPGTTLGTFDYISPEQAKDPRSADIRSDIYSLGCTMYHMLTGQPPYPEGTVLQKLLDHQGKDAPDPASVQPDVPDHLAAIVRRMMNSDRNRRYQTADHLIRDLTYVAGTLGLRGVNPEGLIWVASRSVQPRNWLSHIGWIATAVLLLGLVGILQFNPDWLSPLTGEDDAGLAAVDHTGGDSKNVRPTPGNAGIGESGIATVGPSIDVNASRNTGSTGQHSDEGTETNPDSTVTAEMSEALLRHMQQFPPVSPLIPPLTDGNLIPDLENMSSTPIQFPGAATDEDPGAGTQATSVGPTSTGPVTPDLPIAVYNADKSLNRYVRSLSAACLTVEDGGVIELRASETLTERAAIRIAQKNVTIRGQQGQSPEIIFSPEDEDATVPDVRLFSIQGGRLSLVNVRLKMQVSDSATADRYSLFGVSRGGSLEVRRVVATVEHEQSDRASIVSVGATGREMPANPGNLIGQAGPVSISFVDCLIRGETGFARLTFDLPCSMSIENSAIVARGNLFDVRASKQRALESRRIDLTLNHVSSVLGRSAIRFSSFGNDEMLSQLGIHSRNSIYSPLDADQQQPLIRVDGEIDLADSRRLLDWQGERNFYNAFDEFWVHTAMQDSMSFDDWTLHWGSTAEQGASNDRIVWLRSIGTPLTSVTPSSLSLNEDDQIGNPPVAGATDGTNAGCDLTRLPALAPAASDNADGTTERSAPNVSSASSAGSEE